MKTRKTKNDLPEPVRSEVIGLLNANLADAIHLALHAKQAHWNVRGPHFLQLHQLFDEVHEEAAEWVDTLAERAVQLGGTAEGTLGSVKQRTRLPDYALDLTGGQPHVEAVATSLSTFARAIRAAIDAADRTGDAATADIFTEIVRGADEMLWKVEAHLGER